MLVLRRRVGFDVVHTACRKELLGQHEAGLALGAGDAPDAGDDAGDDVDGGIPVALDGGGSGKDGVRLLAVGLIVDGDDIRRHDAPRQGRKQHAKGGYTGRLKELRSSELGVS